MKTNNRTKYTILGMLAIESLTGYEIIKMIEKSTNFFWSESMGQIYPALAQCLEEGLTTCKEAKAQKIKRPKKIYSITLKGKKELTSWLKKSAQPTLIRNELLLKLFFGKNSALKDNEFHLLHHQQQLEAELTTYEKIYDELTRDYKNSPHLPYWLITLNYGIKTAKTEISWCKESLKLLSTE